MPTADVPVVSEYLFRCRVGDGKVSPWTDLIVKLPTTAAGHDSILVFVERLSKMVHFVATTETLNAQGFAVLFVNNLVRIHGLPRTLISDRGPQFNNKNSGRKFVKFWAWI